MNIIFNLKHSQNNTPKTQIYTIKQPNTNKQINQINQINKLKNRLNKLESLSTEQHKLLGILKNDAKMSRSSVYAALKTIDNFLTINASNPQQKNLAIDLSNLHLNILKVPSILN